MGCLRSNHDDNPGIDALGCDRRNIIASPIVGSIDRRILGHKARAHAKDAHFTIDGVPAGRITPPHGSVISTNNKSVTKEMIELI